MAIDKNINFEEAIRRAFDSSSNAFSTTATLEVGDLEIGAVEIKNGSSDLRVVVETPTNITTGSNAMSVYDANVDDALTTTNSNLSSIKTSVELIDDAVVTDDSAQSSTIKQLNIGGVYDASRTAYSDGDAVVLHTTEYGNLIVSAYDEDLDVSKVIEQSPVWNRYTDPSEIASEQNLTGSYADFGGVINIRGYNRVGLFVVVDANDSEDVDLKVVGLMSATSTDEFEIDGADVKRVWSGTGSDTKIYYEFDIGTVPYIKVQAKAGTVGSTAGDLTISINKKWRA